jgi:hypothetical protein
MKPRKSVGRSLGKALSAKIRKSLLSSLFSLPSLFLFFFLKKKQTKKAKNPSSFPY